MRSGASQKYGTMTLPQIAGLDMRLLCGRGPAVLALWATVPLGDDPLWVMREWGFNFKTTVFWHKTGRLGMGHWFRGQVELLHIGIRGSVRPFKCSKRNIIAHPVLGHSRKPEVFRTLLEEAMPEATRRVELFARRPHPGWETYGLELGFDFLNSRDWTAVCRPW
jgi:N6-adenosine-specific RNA methylase IME4